MSNSKPLLSVKDLCTYFYTAVGCVHAVDGVSIDLHREETFGLVGESGCGKSMTAYSILRLVPDPPGKIVSGEVIYKERNLLKLREKEMRHYRGGEIGMIFQEPMTCLNPVFTIGEQIKESFRLHTDLRGKKLEAAAADMLDRVGIGDARKQLKSYAHQLSGGMRQRVMIAMALAGNPKILLADEPTTALDVTVQAQILELIQKLKDSTGLSVLFITHSLGIISETAQRVAVMYAGQIVEEGNTKDIFEIPFHPYTRGLLKSIPDINEARKTRLDTIEGTVPDLTNLGVGCRFEGRCQYREKKCKIEPQILEIVDNNHKVRCCRYKDIMSNNR